MTELAECPNGSVAYSPAVSLRAQVAPRIRGSPIMPWVNTESFAERDLSVATLFALLLGHELDAVARYEWRLLPLLSSLDDEAGLAAFVLLHVPVVLGLVWGLFVAAPAWRWRIRMALGAFMVVHVGLHFVVEKPGVSTFDHWWSRGLIIGAGAAGAWVLVAHARSKRR